MRTGIDGRFEQFRFVFAGLLESVDQLEFLLHEGALPALREHRIKKNHVRPFGKLPHTFNAVPFYEFHARKDVRKLRILTPTGKRVRKKLGDDRVALIHPHVKPGGRKQKRILTESRRGIDCRRAFPEGVALRRLHQKFSRKASFRNPREQMSEVSRYGQFPVRQNEPFLCFL